MNTSNVRKVGSLALTAFTLAALLTACPIPDPVVVGGVGKKPVIGVAKTADPVLPLGPGAATVTFHIKVQNFSGGASTLGNVQVTEDLTSAFGAISFSASAPTISSAVGGASLTPNPLFNGSSDQNLLTTPSTLPAGSSAVIDVKVDFKTDPCKAQLRNQVKASAGTLLSNGTVSQISISDQSVAGSSPDANGNGSPLDDASPTPFMFDFCGKADLGIVKQLEGQPNPGGTVNYVLAVTNYGVGNSSVPVVVTDVLPAGVSLAPGFLTNQAPWVCSAVTVSGITTVTCVSNTAIPQGNTSTIQIPVVVNVDQGVLVNCASVVSANDPKPDNDRSCVESDVTPHGKPGDLTMDKTLQGPLVNGSQATFTLAVNNVGGSISSGPIIVTDTLPAGLSFATGSFVSGNWNCVIAASTLTCTYTGSFPVASGSLGAISFPVNVNTQPGLIIVNCASVTWQPDPTPANNRDCVEGTVTGDGTTPPGKSTLWSATLSNTTLAAGFMQSTLATLTSPNAADYLPQNSSAVAFRSVAFAVDMNGLNSDLWMASEGQQNLVKLSSVNLMPTGVTTPSQTVLSSTALDKPGAMALDQNGGLWVLNAGYTGSNTNPGLIYFSSAQLAAAGTQNTPTATAALPAGSLNAADSKGGLAFDASDNLWVALVGQLVKIPAVDVASPSGPVNMTGATTYTAPDMTNASGLAMDGAGDLWVANAASSNHLLRYVPGSLTGGSNPYTHAITLNGTIPGSKALGVAFASNGSLWLTRFNTLVGVPASKLGLATLSSSDVKFTVSSLSGATRNDLVEPNDLAFTPVPTGLPLNQ